MIEPGEIYIADFEQFGKHPVVVISREELNRGDYLLVAVCTSARFSVRRRLPNCVEFRAGQFGFTTDCVVQCENLASLEKSQIDLADGPLGVLDETSMRDVIRSIGFVMSSDCEPV